MGGRTSGTRYGRGAGYGGGAKGAGQHGPGPRPGRPRKDVAEVVAMAKAERIAAMKDHLLGLAMTAEREADQITATLGFLRHEDKDAAPDRHEINILTNVDRQLDK